MSYNKQQSSIAPMILGGVVAAFLLFGGVGGCMWGYPKYKVYQQEMDGKAVLAQATSSRRVAVEEAMALKDSAQHKADAEILRAHGVAEANKIIADGLGGPEGYLRYLWVDKMATGPATIYIPTEANIPVTEASRFNRAGRSE